MSRLQSEGTTPKKSLFRKADTDKDAVPEYIETLENSCFVCDRVDKTFARYIDTIFYLWKNNSEFRDMFGNTKGFCTSHYAELRKMAPQSLGKEAPEFIKELDRLYMDNMKRVRDDLEWLIKKFDYRYANEPAGNSKDAIPRAIVKINSTDIDNQSL